MLKILIPTVAVLGLAGFAAQTQPVARAFEAANAPVMAWHLTQEGSAAKLAYGVANSDDLAMMIVCEPGSAAAIVYGDVKPLGAETDRTGGVKVALSGAGLRDLADKGAMRVTGEAGDFNLRASSAERRGVDQFLRYCSRKP